MTKTDRHVARPTAYPTPFPAKDTNMLKFIGGTMGLIFLIGLLVVIGILSLIF